MIYTLVLKEQETLLSFNSVTEFTENQSGTISTYETEKGFPISDNIVFANPKFSISGVLSYFNSPSREIILVDGKFEVREGDVGIETHVELEKKVRDIFKLKTPFSIVKSTDLNDIYGTEVERVESCLIETLSFPYSSTSTGAIYPKLGIVQITTAKVIEEVVANPTAQLIPKDKVATQESVAQSKENDTTKLPDGGKSTDPETVKKAFENDPEAAAKLASVNSQEEWLRSEAAAIRERNRLIDEGGRGADKRYVIRKTTSGFIVIDNNKN